MNIRSIKKIAVFLLPVLLFGSLLFFMNITSPLRAGPAGILAVFVLVYLLVATLFYAIATLFLNLVGYGRASQEPSRRVYYSASILAFAPVFLLAMRTLGQLDLKDFVLVALFVVIATFYVLRRAR